jgi:hypothetical protein
MPQLKFVGDAACFLNVDRRGMKVVVKYGKVILEAFHNVLRQSSIAGWYV